GYEYDFDVGYKDIVNSVPDPNVGIPSYEQDNHKKIVVSYSSINGNGFGGYGEVVMGTKATLVLDREKEVMLYPIAGTYAKAGVKAKGDSVVLDTSASGDAAPAKTAEGSGPVSRGYKEEIEHWAWCISENDTCKQTRCKGEVALGDAVIALTAKQAIKNSQNPAIGHGHIKFQPGWFDMNSPDVPEAQTIEAQQQIMSAEKKRLGLA
ncbi:MAG: gfo/Idh/MocA family oxidoreductase, partial [Planctomycetota bacterium]